MKTIFHRKINKLKKFQVQKPGASVSKILNMGLNYDNYIRLTLISILCPGVTTVHIDDDKKLDKRTIERNLREGIITAEEWKKYLKALPDVSDNADLVMMDEGQKDQITEEQETKSEEPVEKEEATPEKK
jgi:hypothetical protein